MSPEAIRAACARRAWDDDVDDESRALLEVAADCIRELMLRAGACSLRAERAELERDKFRDIAYGVKP